MTPEGPEDRWIEATRERCRAAARAETLGVAGLGALVRSIPVDEPTLAALGRPDPLRPYGRRVILADDRIEGMVATWTRGRPCAPHNHGGSSGAVRVLVGRGRHRVWQLAGDRLRLAFEETVRPGDVLTCGPSMVHSVVDDGDEVPLMTLHLYVDPIPFMYVYDQASQRTCEVEGSCGAWIPADRPELIRAWHQGFHPIP